MRGSKLKNPFKILSFLSLAALLLVSFVQFDTTENVEAVAPAADKVLFLNSSSAKVTYYKPGDTALFYINDADLQTINTGVGLWTSLTTAVQHTSSYMIGSTVLRADPVGATDPDTLAVGINVLACYANSVRGGFGVAGSLQGPSVNLASESCNAASAAGLDLSGGANSGDFTMGKVGDMDDDNTILASYDSATPANTPFSQVPSVKIGANNATIDNYSSASGTFSLVNGVNAAAGDNVEVTFKYHLTDTYTSTTGTATASNNRAKITSTSDPIGEWVDISEVAAYTAAASSATSNKYRGKLDLSNDASKSAAGDNNIWVQEADTLTVTFYDTDHTTVINSHSVTIDATNPTITAISPSDGSYIKDTSPTLTFSIGDLQAGLDTTTLGNNVALSIRGETAHDDDCVVADSELTFTSVSSTVMNISLSIAAAGTKWSAAPTYSSGSDCADRNGGGFGLDTSTLQASGNSHGKESYFTITATDKAGNTKTVTTTSSNFRIDSVAPDMISAATGTWWDATNLVDKTTGAAIKNTVKVVFNEALDPASVSIDDFEVDDVKPASLVLGGKNSSASTCLAGTGGTCVKNEFVYLTMGTDLSPDSKPKIEMVGNVTDLAGNALKASSSASTYPVADTVTATDSQKPSITLETLTVKTGTLADLLDTAQITTLSWTASEKLSGSSTIIKITGGNTTATVSTNAAVTMTTPTTGSFLAKQANAPFNATTTGIYGMQIKNVDLASNSTVSGMTKVTDEDVSSQITGNVAASAAIALKLANWPIADADADGSIMDDFAISVDGVAYTLTDDPTEGCGDVEAGATFAITNFDFSENEKVNTCVGNAITATSIVKVTYHYANASNVVEIDTAGPTLTFDPAGGTSTEKSRPYVSIIADDDEYADDTYTTVTITKATLKSPSGVTTDISGNLTSADNKRFIYAPTADMELGQWTVTAQVTDTAGNKSTETTNKFTVKARAKFSLGLKAGWNLLSLPNNPSDTSIDSVVGTANGVSTVYSYEGGAWKVAVREKSAGAWGAFAGSLTTMEGHKAYWVKSADFQSLKIDIPALVGGASGSDTPPTPPTIPVNVGWNMVAAVDTSGLLKDDATVSTIKVYLTGLTVTKIYEYDTAGGSWTGYASDDSSNNIKVGRGYWLYATKSGTLVP
jgi:hypothetical protein